MYIKPIETVYNGYKFRSRLEARWAVFFDEIGVKYYYEYEGFLFSDGTKYLPDFYLPEFNIMVEIKPNREMDDGKAEKFAKNCTNFDDNYLGIVVCYGEPSDFDCYYMTMCESDDGGGGEYENECEFMCPSFDVPFLLMKGDKRERNFGNMFIITEAEGLGLSRYKPEAEKSRKARFEYGEKG